MNPRRPASWLFVVTLIFPLLARAQSNGFDSGGRASLSGRVLLLGSNFPAQRVEVKLTPISGGLPFAVLTDAEGRFQMNGLHEGTYFLGVREKGYDEIQETVQVSRGSGGLTFWLKKSDAPAAEETGPTVSVRELSIPAKARHEFQKGMERREKEDPAGSVPHFQRAIGIFPSYYEAYLQMGFANESMGQTAEAEKAIRTSVELSDENFAEADFALCELLDNQKQFDDAEKMARHGLQLSPASWVGHFLLSQALYGMNRFKEAEESAKKVLSLKRNFASVHLLLANIHLRRHDRPALLEDLNSYLTLDPDGPQATQARHLREAVQQSLAAAAPAGNQ
ncbi:MAG TPA: tetratricopeptide repeat protein [Candidatus Acidoferrales bacterium]|nr:tetratricopeptide repeat protein [Candidatus Acidoferrales bacterium]